MKLENNTLTITITRNQYGFSAIMQNQEFNKITKKYEPNKTYKYSFLNVIFAKNLKAKFERMPEKELFEVIVKKAFMIGRNNHLTLVIQEIEKISKIEKKQKTKTEEDKEVDEKLPF